MVAHAVAAANTLKDVETPTVDAMDILGSLLGGGQGGGQGGLGDRILKDLIQRGQNQRVQAPAGHARTGWSSSATPRAPERRPISIEERASELEDLLGVAHERYQQSQPSSRPEPPLTPPRSSAPPVSNAPRNPAPASPPHQEASDVALVLVRAMINAAKADGNISQQEQQVILERIANPSQGTIDFLRQEFATPLNVRDFAWSVPLGLEQQVYTLSLATIDIDSPAEVNYLRELAHGLRIGPEICEEIHRRYGAASLFR